MDEVGIIMLTLFLFLLIFGPLYRPVCVTYSRVKDHRKFHPRTSQFRDARRKLSTVSECTTIGREKLDIESKLNQHDSGPECPICIGPLFVSSDHNATGAGPMQAGPSHASGSGGDGRVLEGSGGQTHSGVGGVKKKLAERWWRVMQRWKGEKHASSDEVPHDDILTLKKCHHAFHSKCLSSWFLIERYDCPVCRSQYWQTREMRARAASAPPEPGGSVGDGAGGGGVDGSGIARPPAARIAVERLSVPII